jgi:UDP:flavonoid glycosyltransferase YjiC (YdhE family)
MESAVRMFSHRSSKQDHDPDSNHYRNAEITIEPVPNNAVIVKRAPQLELSKQTSACITHAGLNTVLESSAQGVSQVAIPVTHD